MNHSNAFPRKHRSRETHAAAFLPIRYTARQVSLMCRVATYYHPAAFSNAVSLDKSEVRAIIEQRCSAPASVLRYFRLTPSGSEYIWDPAVDEKMEDEWGPPPTRTGSVVQENGAALHHAIETIESSFASL